MRIIALGGNGFIGSHFVRIAVDAGHDLVVVDLAATPRHDHRRTHRFIQGGVADLAQRPDLLSEADVVCHFAYSTVPASASADPARDLSDNVLPLIALVEAMEAVGQRRIVYLSSGGAVYGAPQIVPISEDHPLRPISAYGVSKAASENYLCMYQAARGLRPTILRPANPYGVDQGRVGLLGAVTTFLNQLAADAEVTIWGDGSAVRDYVHIDDLCALLLRAAECDVCGTFNCGSGRGHSLNDLIAIIERVTGKQLRVAYQPARAFDPPQILLDISRAADQLGWSPRIGLEEGVRELARTLGLPII